MNRTAHATITRAWPLLVFATSLVIVFAIYPPFRVGKVGADGKLVRSSESTAVFDPVSYAAEFWEKTLQPASEKAPELPAILELLRQDPAAAARRFGHKAGLGSTSTFFARGLGTIKVIERNRVLVEVDGSTIAIRTGPVFGNVVRDGTGLLDVNQLPGLEQFNALSAEINRLIETRVQPRIKSMPVGARIEFVGCAEAPESLSQTDPLLTFVPVRASVHP